MTSSLLRKSSIWVLLSTAALLMNGCGKSVTGHYSDDSNMFSVDLKSDGTATVNIGGTTQQGKYTADSKTVTLTVDGETKTFTIYDDGTLGGGNGITLKKRTSS
jgi:hypothetical protein